MGPQSIESASALPIALALIPSLPRPLLKHLVERAIDHLDALDGDSDLEDDDGDTGIKDDPQGCDPETDFCLGHDDRSTGSFLRARDRHELRRVRRSIHAL